METKILPNKLTINIDRLMLKKKTLIILKKHFIRSKINTLSKIIIRPFSHFYHSLYQLEKQNSINQII
jgi:hypothetical protein